MAINVYWDTTDAAVLHLDFAGRYTWDEFDAKVETLVDLIAQAEYGVVVMVDMTCAAPMPPDGALEHLRRAVELAPANVEMSIIALEQNRFGRIMLNKVISMYRQINDITMYVESVEAAYALVANRRQNRRSYG